MRGSWQVIGNYLLLVPIVPLSSSDNWTRKANCVTQTGLSLIISVVSYCSRGGPVIVDAIF